MEYNYEDIQPQLNNQKFFGQPVVQKLLKSGDVLYYLQIIVHPNFDIMNY